MTSPAGDKLLRVRDADRIFEFRGRSIASVTTESPTSVRWTEMNLYHLTDGTDRYVLQTVGRSVVYHEHDGPCNSGTATKMFDLPEDAEPCPRCRPRVYEEGEVDPELDEVVVDLESDRYAVHVCGAAADVIARLRISRTLPSSLDSFSAPARRLLDNASEADPGVAAALQVVERL